MTELTEAQKERVQLQQRRRYHADIKASRAKGRLKQLKRRLRLNPNLVQRADYVPIDPTPRLERRKAKLKLMREMEPEKTLQAARERYRRWAANNKDKVKQNAVEYRKSNLDATRASSRASYRKYKDRYNQSRIERRYGLTAAQHEALRKKQNNNCAICGHQQKGRDLAIDHCHLTGKVRGLLCQKCNSGLGLFRDSLDLLRRAVSYMEAQ